MAENVVYVWTGGTNEEKISVFQKNPDTCGRGLNCFASINILYGEIIRCASKDLQILETATESKYSWVHIFLGYLSFSWTRKRLSGKPPKHHSNSIESHNWKQGYTINVILSNCIVTKIYWTINARNRCYILVIFWYKWKSMYIIFRLRWDIRVAKI